MTKDDWDVLAAQSGGRLESWMSNPPKPAMWHFTPEARDKFAALVAAKEREAAAQVCESFKQGNAATYIDDDWADMCAAAIRARGEQA